MKKKIYNKIDYKKYEAVFKQAELLAKKTYNKYRSRMIENLFDINDFVSEIHLIVCKIIHKYKSKSVEEIIKLSGIATFWKLQDILKRSRLYSKRFLDISDMLKSEKGDSISHESFLDFISNKEYNNDFTFNDLTSICDDREYEIIVQKVREGRTFSDIAKTFNVRKGRGKNKESFTRQGIERIYKKGIDKVKKFYIDFYNK